MQQRRYTVEELLADEVFQRWALRRASYKEHVHWQQWVEACPENERIADEAAEAIQGLAFREKKLPAGMIDEAWRQLEGTLNAIQRSGEREGLERKRADLGATPRATVLRSPRKPASRSNRGSLFSKRSLGVVGILTLLVALGGLFIVYPDLIHRGSGLMSYTTVYGERVSVALPDGSYAVLNGHSSLSFPKSYQEGTPYEVVLDGEAYFEVAKRSGEYEEEKFIVATQRGSVQVLGTIFTVTSRGPDVRVALNEGAVKVVNEANDSVLLEPGHAAYFGVGTEGIRVHRVNPYVYSSWTTPHLLFEKTPFQEIVSMLKDTYGFNVQVEDHTVWDVSISGTIENDSEALLSALAEMIGRVIEVNGRELIIK